MRMVNDRTFEFRSTIDTISGGQTTLTGSSGYLSNNFQTNQFLEKATAMTRELSKNSLKLEQLTKRNNIIMIIKLKINPLVLYPFV